MPQIIHLESKEWFTFISLHYNLDACKVYFLSHCEQISNTAFFWIKLNMTFFVCINVFHSGWGISKIMNWMKQKNLGGVEEMEKLLGGDVGESIWVLLNPKVGEIKLLRALMLFRTAKLPRIAYGVEFKWLLIVWSDGRNHGQGSRQKKNHLSSHWLLSETKLGTKLFFVPQNKCVFFLCF